jgi:hypothetical protein
MDVATKFVAAKNRIMFFDLSIMNPDQSAWFEKKRAIICERDACSRTSILLCFIVIRNCALFANCLATIYVHFVID